MTITGPYHVNINCSDLEASLAFYTEVLGFGRLVHTAPDEQDGAAFGFDRAQWDAWILTGDDDGVVLDLLEWKVPTPGRAPRKPGDAGFTHLIVSVPDPLAIAPSAWINDPDGTAIKLVAGDEVAVVGVGIGSADPTTTNDFIGTHLEGSTGFLLVSTVAEPDHRAANDLGIYRMAWLTDDIATDHSTLVTAGLTELSAPIRLAMGIEGSDISLEASFLVDDNGCCFELIAPPA